MPDIYREKMVKCPNCESESLRRSHRQDIERFLGWFFPIAPYICKDCWRRFWMAKNPLQSWASKITVGIAVFAIALLLLTPRQDSRRSVSMAREGLSEDIQKSKTLLSNTYVSKILSPSDFEGKVSSNQSSSEVEPSQGTWSDSYSLNGNKQVERQLDPVNVGASLVPTLAMLATQTTDDLVETRIPGGTNEGPKVVYYSVHLESYRNFGDAKERAVELIAEEGLHAWLRKVKILGKGKWFRVYIGKKKSKAEALSLGKRLKAERIIEDFSVHRIKEAKPGTP